MRHAGQGTGLRHRRRRGDAGFAQLPAGFSRLQRHPVRIRREFSRCPSRSGLRLCPCLAPSGQRRSGRSGRPCNDFRRSGVPLSCSTIRECHVRRSPPRFGAPRSPYAATFTVAAPVSNGCWVNPPQHRSKDPAPAWKEGQHDPPDPSPWPTARCAGRPAGHRPVRRPAPRPKGRPPSALLELPFRGGIREKRHQYKAEDDDK